MTATHLSRAADPRHRQAQGATRTPDCGPYRKETSAAKRFASSRPRQACDTCCNAACSCPDKGSCGPTAPNASSVSFAAPSAQELFGHAQALTEHPPPDKRHAADALKRTCAPSRWLPSDAPSRASTPRGNCWSPWASSTLAPSGAPCSVRARSAWPNWSTSTICDAPSSRLVPGRSYRCQVRLRSVLRSRKTSRTMKRLRQRSTSFFDRPSARRRRM